MKLSKIILENKKIVHKAELNLSEEDINRLTEAITEKLKDYLDIEESDLLLNAVKGAISELLV
jgi:uncharacterized protein (DUF2267 family)